MSSTIEKIENEIKLLPKGKTEISDLKRLSKALVKKAEEIQS